MLSTRRVSRSRSLGSRHLVRLLLTIAHLSIPQKTLPGSLNMRMRCAPLILSLCVFKSSKLTKNIITINSVVLTFFSRSIPQDIHPPSAVPSQNTSPASKQHPGRHTPPSLPRASSGSQNPPPSTSPRPSSPPQRTWCPVRVC